MGKMKATAKALRCPWPVALLLIESMTKPNEIQYKHTHTHAAKLCYQRGAMRRMRNIINHTRATPEREIVQAATSEKQTNQKNCL